MNNSNERFDKAEYVTVGRKQNIHQSFRRKDNTINDTNLIVICVIAFIVGLTLYMILK
jgi:hypothetical protein